MRRLVDSGMAVMLVLVVGIVGYHAHQQHHLSRDIEFVHRSLAQLHEQSLYQAAVSPASETVAGFPVQMEPAWFEHGLPRNVMVGREHPWMDIADAEDAYYHPPDPVIDSSEQAGIWYNPNRGIFRARVPRQLSERATLELYNKLNGTNLSAWPSEGGERKPAFVIPLPEPQWQSALLNRGGVSESELAALREAMERERARQVIRPTLRDVQ